MSKSKETIELTASDFSAVYEELTASVVCSCRFISSLVGGQPAADKDLRAFIAYHLKLEGDKAEEAFRRIKTQEIGHKDTTPEAGEIHEEEIYGVNIIRRAEQGPWIGDWMVKACLKAAASRAGLFTATRGLKGDVAEGGRVRAAGNSLLDPGQPMRIFIYIREDLIQPLNGFITVVKPAPTRFEKIMGRVLTPLGDKSISHHSEVIDAGARFEFQFQFLPSRIDLAGVKQVLALAGNIGLGSAKALERGKFEIESCHVVGVNREKEAKSAKRPKAEPEAQPAPDDPALQAEALIPPAFGDGIVNVVRAKRQLLD